MEDYVHLVEVHTVDMLIGSRMKSLSCSEASSVGLQDVSAPRALSVDGMQRIEL